MKYPSYTAWRSLPRSKSAAKNHFKYLGAISSGEGSKTEILAKAVQTTVAMMKLKLI